MKRFFKYEFVYDNEVDDEEMILNVLEAFGTMEWIVAIDRGASDQPFSLTHRGFKAAHCFHNLLRNYFEGYWLVLRAFRHLQKKNYSEKDFIKKILGLGEKAIKLELIERPESVSKIMFGNALKFYAEMGLLEKKVDKEDGEDQSAEQYAFRGDGGQVQEYSRQISRFLRSPHFALHYPKETSQQE
jgi:glycerol-3-phosphate O-acyltransferase